MRHGKKFNTLGRTASHRKHMLSNMAASLITHKRINTTVPKAKALRKYVEPLITRSKDDTTHSRREVFRYLQDKEAVNELFREVGPKVADRPGGYLRIIRLGPRKGDGAEVAMVELVDYNELMLQEKEEQKSGGGKRRRRRGGRKKSGGQKGAEASAGAEAQEGEASEAEASAPAEEESSEESSASSSESSDEEKKDDSGDQEDEKGKDENDDEKPSN